MLCVFKLVNFFQFHVVIIQAILLHQFRIAKRSKLLTLMILYAALIYTCHWLCSTHTTPITQQDMRHSLLVHIHCYLSLSRHTCKNIVKCVCMFNVKLLYINIIIIWLHWPMHSPRTSPGVLNNPVWFSRHSAVVANNQNYSDMNTLLLHEYQYWCESSDNIVISWWYIDPQFFISNLVLLIILQDGGSSCTLCLILEAATHWFVLN